MPLPATLIDSERQTSLDRMLGHISDPVLTALAKALEDGHQQLSPGRLYSGGGGCAVGLMLCYLFPESQSGPLSRLRRRFQRSVHDLDIRHLERTRLAHVEMMFDRTVKDGRNQGLTKAKAASATGLWLAASCRRELARRQEQALAGLFVPSGWQTEPSVEKINK